MNAAINRLRALLVVFLGFGAILLLRAAFLQVIPHARLEAMAKRQFASRLLVRPRRGGIVDRNGEPLAINAETRSLAANPTKLRDRKRIAWLLSKTLTIPYDKMLARLSEPREFVWIKRHMADGELEEFRKWRLMDSEGDLVAGLWLIKESKRVYPHGDLASPVLGGVNIDSEGIEGVEFWQNPKLSGKIVSLNAVKDAKGRPTFLDASVAQGAKDGDDVSLTLDASLQYSVEKELRQAVDRTQSRSGMALVMNAVTGEIVTLAQTGGVVSIASDGHRSRPLVDGYEPGSTVKPLILAGLLATGAKLTDSIYAHKGSLTIQGRTISEAETHERYEWLTLKEIIKYSSNVGAVKMALKLGSDRTLQTLGAFGLGVKSGTGFPGELTGRLPTRKETTPLRLATMGFGQGIFVTPVQMLRAYGVFANNGWLVEPKILRTEKRDAPEAPPKRVLSEAQVAQVVSALKSVTEDKGTGVKAVLPGYEVVGKTGTAQVVDPETKRYSAKRYISSFIGFATNQEKKFVILTALDEPKGVYYATETAAPLFREVLAAVTARFGMPTTVPVIQAAPALALSDSKKPSVAAAPIASPPPIPRIDPAPIPSLASHGVAPNGRFQWTMPDLNGLSAREALRVLQGEDEGRLRKFHFEAHGEGIIRAQVPAKGGVLTEGGLVSVVLVDP